MRKCFVSIITFAVAFAASAQSRLYPNEFDLGDVIVTDEAFKHAQHLNVDVLLSYDVDRLLAPFYKEAGLTPKGESFSNWDGLDGHVGGHYLSALAIHYAATGDPRLKQRMDYVLDALEECQNASPDGYVGGVPGSAELWQQVALGNVDKVRDRWVPWYNIHKTFAGLRDAWNYGGSERAKKMFLRLCDWCVDEIKYITDADMERMLDVEFGGMNEVLADAYAITGDQRYLSAAKRFSHHMLLDSMAAGIDNLDNRHANTQVPKAVGYQRVAELDPSDDTYARAADFFWHTVSGTRSLALGGNSRREHFPPADDCESYITDREGPETCNTNNMLKLTEGLFRMHPRAEYADFYERASLNHILSSQHPGHGGYVYFTSARPGHYRVYSAPNAAMWCCVGTGMENHGKYGQFIYTHPDDSTLQVNLYTSSLLNWRKKGLTVEISGDMPYAGKVKITVDPARPTILALKLRVPAWAEDFNVRLNEVDQTLRADVDGYVTIKRKWKKGDVITIDMPMSLRLEQLPDVPEYSAIMYGPVLLASRYGTPEEGLQYVADDGRWGHIAAGALTNLYDVPALVGTTAEILAAIEPMPEKGHFRIPAAIMPNSSEDIILEPFAGIHDSRYVIYRLAVDSARYAEIEKRRAAETMALELDARTIDAVNTGEQQPEADHSMVQHGSDAGISNGERWRAAKGKKAFFEYTLTTGAAPLAELIVRYNAADSSRNTLFNILVNNEIIARETLAGLSADGFAEKHYTIPQHLVDGHDSVKVRFETVGNAQVAKIYSIKLIKPIQ